MNRSETRLTARIASAARPAVRRSGSTRRPGCQVVAGACGIAAIVGHVYPVWHGFRGGKGVATLVGVIALRQENRPAARQAFTDAITHTETLLSSCAQNYAALDSKGLALCGLALTEDPQRRTEAVAAYRAARAVTKAPGIVQRALRLFDALAQADAHGVLAANGGNCGNVARTWLAARSASAAMVSVGFAVPHVGNVLPPTM